MVLVLEDVLYNDFSITENLHDDLGTIRDFGDHKRIYCYYTDDQEGSPNMFQVQSFIDCLQTILDDMYTSNETYNLTIINQYDKSLHYTIDLIAKRILESSVMKDKIIINVI